MPDECIKFDNLKDYQEWVLRQKSIGIYSFQPVCSQYFKHFDKMVLMLRNKRLLQVPLVYPDNK